MAGHLSAVAFPRRAVSRHARFGTCRPLGPSCGTVSAWAKRCLTLTLPGNRSSPPGQFDRW